MDEESLKILKDIDPRYVNKIQQKQKRKKNKEERERLRKILAKCGKALF